MSGSRRDAHRWRERYGGMIWVPMEQALAFLRGELTPPPRSLRAMRTEYGRRRR